MINNSFTIKKNITLYILNQYKLIPLIYWATTFHPGNAFVRIQAEQPYRIQYPIYLKFNIN